MSIKMRLLVLKKKQVDLLPALSSIGVVVDAPELSRAINGCPQPRYEAIRKAVDIVLTAWEE